MTTASAPLTLARLVGLPAAERRAVLDSFSVAELIAFEQELAQGDYREWLRQHFGAYVTAPMGERHLRFWEWIESLSPGERPRPRVEIWPRGGAKSSSAELGCVRLGITHRRRYVLYVSETQAQADKHVQAIAAMLERTGSTRATNEYGTSKGWRRAELRTADGFNVTAYGLDSALRGIKLDEIRPDCIVLDDIDGRQDTPAARGKKVDAITTSILPAGSADCAILVMQNRITKDSIVSQLADGRADFLHDREKATEEPAVLDLQVERVLSDDGASYRIVAGRPTWQGQGIPACEKAINAWGLSAFLREAQHEVDELEGGLWDRMRDIEPFRVMQHPTLSKIVVLLDPSASTTGDEAGIVVTGIDAREHGYVLDDLSLQGSPKQWAERAVLAYHRWKGMASSIVFAAEQNQGGEMILATIATVPDAPKVELIHASQSKIARAEPVQKLAEDGLIHHVGVFPQLERELCQYKPGMPSPNRMDAYVHGLGLLLVLPEKKRLQAW